MKIEIKKSNKKFTINLKPITQLIGTNFYLKNYIIDSITKHFSNSKYLDYEEEKIDNITYNNEIIGRKYFATYIIKNIDDIIDNIKIGKTSLTFKYLNYLMKNFDCQQDVDNIDKLLHNLYSNINNEIRKNIDDINIYYNIEDIINVLAKSEVFNIDNDPLYNMSALALLTVYIQLIKTLYDYTPNKILLIIENVDHLLEKHQYDILLKKIPKIINNREIYILFTSSINNYVYTSKDTLTGINVINNIIFNVPNIESIIDFLERTYPSTYNINENELYTILSSMLNDVGNEHTEKHLKSQIFLTLFNKTLSIETRTTNKLNEIELQFINN